MPAAAKGEQHMSGKQSPEGFADFVRSMTWDEIIGLKGEAPVAALEGQADSLATRLRSLPNVPAAIVEQVVESVKKADPVAGLLSLLTGTVHGMNGVAEDVKASIADALKAHATEAGLDLPVFAFGASEDDADGDGDGDGDAGDGDADGDADDGDADGDDDAGDGDADTSAADSAAAAEAQKAQAKVAMHEELATLDAQPDVQALVREAVEDRILSTPGMNAEAARAAVRQEFKRSQRSSEAWGGKASAFDDMQPQGDGVDSPRAAEADGAADSAKPSPLESAFLG